MNNFSEEEMHYCTYCGAIQKKSQVNCTECEKKIRGEYRPFYDFVKKHTKDDISGTVKDAFFVYLKKFLMSHVYGIALSVTVVAATVSTVAAAQPHIEKIPANYTVTPVAVQEEKPAFGPITEDDLYAFYHLAGNLDCFADNNRASDSYWATDMVYYGAPAEMYAETNIENFPYVGVHEMVSNAIPMYMLDEDPNFADMDYSHVYSDRYSDNSSAVTGAACTSELAKKLHEDGYRVAECNYVLCEAEGEYSYETHTGSNVVKKLVYKFVYVEHEGEWYIAEDRLIHRQNV